MRLLGMVGGSSSVSTAEYYGHLNRLVNERLGGHDAARLVLWSMNFGDLQRNNLKGDHHATGQHVLEGCHKVEAAGAEGVIICANTLHMFADEIQPQIGIPIIHLIDALAVEIRSQGLRKVLLLGTRYTMEMSFFRDRLAKHGVEANVPNDADRDFVHGKIYSEMVKGLFPAETRDEFTRIVSRGVESGAEGVIMGCTEIPLLFARSDLGIPKFDTTLIHAQAAVEFMLGPK